MDRIDCRRKVGELRPPRRQLALCASFSSESVATPLPLLVLGAMAAGGGRRIESNGGGGGELRQESFFFEEEERDGGSEIGEGIGG